MARVLYGSRIGGSLCRAICSLLFVGALSAHCAASGIVLVRGRQRHPAEEGTIQRLAEFYGVNLQTVEVGSRDSDGRAIQQLRNPGTLAVLASQEALSRLDKKKLQAALRGPGSLIPMLVFGVQASGDPKQLQFWSGGAIRECAPLESNFRPKTLNVGNAGALTGALAGLELPAVALPTCSLRFDPAPRILSVLSAHGSGEQNGTVLVRAQSNVADVFFVPEMQPLEASWVGKPDSLPSAFSSMAPFIMFLSYAVGDYAWHSDGHYANLTIDDAWLTQPFGHLDYAALLPEMERHNFHTTIAFIPWNFDRSEPATVALFRKHPGRFSICVHGNNHDHREFGDYASHPLPDQIADIKQGIARMERFSVLTNLSYDRFMVFPHAEAPEETFSALRTYGFLGTANAVNVPLGDQFPADPAFLLRPYTAAYANLLSLSRYPAGGQIPRLEIAIQSFLGNPIVFYGHENLFGKGVTAFNDFADFVNQVQAGTQWTSLGAIARHSHLIHLREDGAFDVQMFSSEADLKNPTDKTVLFYIRRDESFSPAIRSLTVDGTPAAFERSDGMLTFRLIIPAHEVRKLRIAYENDFDLSREDIRKKGIRAYVLRRISDFRDLHLTRSKLGTSIAETYYRNNWDSLELYLERWYLLGVLGVGLACGGLLYYKRKTTKRTGVRTTPN